MAEKVLITKSKISGIADAIRTKTGSTDVMTLDSMATNIDNIPSGGGKFDASQLKSVYFSTTLTDVDLSCLDTSALTSLSFSSCSKLTTLDLSCLDLSKITKTTSMFNGCSALTTLNLGNLSTSASIVISTFSGCTSLTKLKIGSETDTKVIKGYTNMFVDCPADLKIYVPKSLLNTYKSAAYWSAYADQIRSHNLWGD